MGRIAINGMRFYAHHGCFDEERAIGTHFVVDIWMEVDTRAAEVSDNIADTVNYLEVYQVVKHEMETPSNLLERVARRVGEAVMSQFADTMLGNVVESRAGDVVVEALAGAVRCRENCNSQPSRYLSGLLLDALLH